MATLYRADGTIETVEPENPKRGFKLAELYKMLNAELVEVVYPVKGYSSPTFSKPRGQIMIVDEEGVYRHGDKFNACASRLFGYSPIFGDALVCKSKEFR